MCVVETKLMVIQKSEIFCWIYVAKLSVHMVIRLFAIYGILCGRRGLYVVPVEESATSAVSLRTREISKVRGRHTTTFNVLINIPTKPGFYLSRNVNTFHS